MINVAGCPTHPDWVTETPPGKLGGKLAAMASLLTGGEGASGFQDLQKALRSTERGAGGSQGEDGAAPNSAKTTSSETTFETLGLAAAAGGRQVSEGTGAATATEGGQGGWEFWQVYEGLFPNADQAIAYLKKKGIINSYDKKELDAFIMQATLKE